MQSAAANSALWDLANENKCGELNAPRTSATHEVHEYGRCERCNAEKK
jgi:hypothetical protein